MIGWNEKKRYESIMTNKRSPKGELLASGPLKPEVVKMENGEVDPLHIAAKDIIMAHHERSAEKLKQAMRNFIDLHHNTPHDDEPSEGPEGI